MRIVLGVELLGGRIDVGRIDPQQRRLGLRLGRGEGQVRGDLDLFLYLCLDGLDLGLGGHAVGNQALGETRDGIALGLFLPLARRLVEDLIVRQRVRVRARDVRMDERGPFALAAPLSGPDDRFVRGDRIATVHFRDQ